MNERIKALAEQSGFIFWKDESWGPGPGNIDWGCDYSIEFNDFIKLLIKECARIGELKEQGCSEYDPNSSVGWYMHQHFGIK
jgi:hypothetical protein